MESISIKHEYQGKIRRGTFVENGEERDCGVTFFRYIISIETNEDKRKSEKESLERK
jgi:hypothetical protein